MLKLFLAWVRGGKTNTAMIALVIVYALNKYFGIVTTETNVIDLVAVVLGAVGQLHKVYKSELVQKVIAGIKAKTDEKPII
ncbi:hypothetical protein CCP3SC15_1550005 [Gammaproteobacteria bacterium]